MIHQTSLRSEANGLNWSVQTALTVSSTTLHVDVSDDSVVYVPAAHTLVIPNAVDPTESRALSPTASTIKMNLLRATSSNATVRVILA